jgi:hypothetical protein
MVKYILFVFFLFTSSVAHLTTILTPIFNNDNVRRAISIDNGQFPLNFETEFHFVFCDNYPNSTKGGSIFWNQVNKVDDRH